MKSNKVIQRIEELRPSTESSILFRQKHLVPSYVDLNPRVIWDAYYIAGDRFTITSDFKYGLVVNNLPYFEDYLDRRENPYFIDSLENMVKRHEISPILIFYNDKFIPWSRIKIVRDVHTSYMLIKDADDYLKADTLKCIAFPFNIRYTENFASGMESEFLFRFNKNGKLDNTKGTIGIAPVDPCVFSKLCTSSEPIWHYNVHKNGSIPLDDKYSIGPDNCRIVFKDGILDTNASVEIGKNSLLNIDNGNQDYSSISIALFYFLDTTANEYSHESKIVNKEELVAASEAGTIDSNEEILLHKLDFSYKENASYDKNIASALKTIMNYDSELMDKVYTDLSLVSSLECTGQQYIKLAKNGYIFLQKARKKTLDDGTEQLIKVYPMIFVNNQLYVGMRAILDIGNLFKIPIFGIAKSDHVEILLFKEVINLTFKAEHASVYDDPFLSRIDNISTEEVLDNLDDYNIEIYTSTRPYRDQWPTMTSIDEFDRVQFKMDREIIREGDGKVGFEVNLGSETFLGNIPITLVSRKQFRYMGFVTNIHRISFQLSPDFNYCLNKNQYMVFVNGKKINQDNFRLISAARRQPFDDISIYMTYEMSPNDRVDVFYLPIPMREYVTAPRIPVSGNIYLDREQFDYGLNKNMHLIFVNGDKVAPSSIKNVSSSKVHIDADIKTLNDLCILQHIKPIDVLRDAFIMRESEWDTIMDSLEYDRIAEILGYKNKTITDKQEDFNAWQVSPLEVSTTIAKDYWLSARINEGEPYNYDHDEIIIDGKDPLGITTNKLENAMLEYQRIHEENAENIADDELAAAATYNTIDEEAVQFVLERAKGYINRRARYLEYRILAIEAQLTPVDFGFDGLFDDANMPVDGLAEAQAYLEARRYVDELMRKFNARLSYIINQLGTAEFDFSDILKDDEDDGVMTLNEAKAYADKLSSEFAERSGYILNALEPIEMDFSDVLNDDDTSN